jgi:hypothetical protein
MARRRTAPPEMVVAERDLQAEVITLARTLGWGVTKSQAERLAADAKAYGIPALPLDGLIFHPRYSLGSEPGWPDLTLIRRSDRRLVFAELKTAKGFLSPRQTDVLDLLRELAFDPADYWPIEPRESPPPSQPPRIEVHVWRPADLVSGAIAEVLR